KRGLKGRTPRVAERSLMDKIGALPCIACYVHGVINEVVSLHHINGRTITGAHAFVLPLCNHHHQYAAPPAIRAIYPWLVPVHADGNYGGRITFEALNGTQEHLYNLCLEMIA
ncbi:recombinase, partial [Salmonella enterica]|nr:recombinase [Salmonella enterica]